MTGEGFEMKSIGRKASSVFLLLVTGPFPYNLAIPFWLGGIGGSCDGGGFSGEDTCEPVVEEDSSPELELSELADLRGRCADGSAPEESDSSSDDESDSFSDKELD
jgi:hypothetical protein